MDDAVELGWIADIFNPWWGRADISGFVVDESGAIRIVNRTARDVTLSNDTELVVAQAGRRIRVLALFYRAALAVTVRFKSAGNNLSASYALGVTDDLVWPYNQHGWIETNAGEALAVNQSLAVASGAEIQWVAV